MKELLDLLIIENLDLFWSCYAAVNTVDKDLLKNYHLLGIKGLDFTVKEFKTISGMLGEIIPHDILKYRHPEHEMLSYVTNVDREGNLDKFGA